MRDMGIGSWPARRARMVPGGMALVQGDRRLTYGQLAARVDRLAAGFRALGVQPGDRVAYLGPNDIATFETLFATAHLGAVFVPLNTRLAAPEIAYLLEDSGAKVLVHGPEHAAVVAETAPHDRGVAHVVTGLDAVPVAASPGDEPGTLDDPCLILYTSGTTGLPKGAVLTHGNLTWNTVNQLAHFDLVSTDVALCVAPLFHVTGLGQVTMPTFFKGGAVVVAPKFDAEWMLRSIGPLSITGFNIYPAEVEAALGEVDGVVDCAVVAVPDEKWGEVGLAFIVTRDAEPLDEELVRKHQEHRLARYKIPKHLRQVDVLPRNATGKLLRRQLRDRVRTELTTGEDAT